MPYFEWKGHKLFYRQQGEGPLLLLLPGNSASSICLQGEMNYFCNRFCTVSPDFLGTGQSERVDVWPQDWWEQAASQMEHLIDQLGYKDCVIMGTSGGAVIALLTAINFPGKVRAVIADSFVDQISKDVAQQNILSDRARKTPLQRQFWEYAHGADWEKVVKADSAMFMQFVEAGGDWFSGRLIKVECPVLVTASKQDDALPNIVHSVFTIVEQVRDCRAFINDKGGHPMMWTAQNDFRAVSDYFLERFL